ncbi:tRNA dihydrouridine synthase DusB [Haloplasma contractile]|uniref:tRNA-dihydrouridine synthase n=1 Tax=Haloplasma contractile SSD-17B TaxID=1033810 RepID=U2FMP9_9MOLU|nr:tRNA dihydrouridine synthase DusB [Haloplasma contractile]ERJ12424.1 putative tRNA-dihydrouridine synthase 1 protein [Haloplasma contractile SSD-17B]
MKWKIDDINIDNQVVIAPMAGIGNVAFRTICKEMGAGLIYAEMVSDKALVYNNEKTWKMLRVDDEEQPVAMQVFGGDIDTIVEGAKIIDQHCDAKMIDINMGCPVPKITKSDAGAKLLLEPDKIYEIVARVVDTVDKTVTVKMRTGWDKNHIYAMDIAKKCEQAGAKAIAIHGRTRSQMYEGTADWDIIKDVKKEIKTIPVIGNGDVKTPQDAKRLLEDTNVDAVMIGRAVLGNPWLIRKIVTYLEKGILIDDPTHHEKMVLAKKHMQKLIDLKGEKQTILEMRSHIPWYIKGLHGANNVKRKINTMTDLKEINVLLDEYEDYLTEYIKSN